MIPDPGRSRPAGGDQIPDPSRPAVISLQSPIPVGIIGSLGTENERREQEKEEKPGDAWIAAVSAYLDVYLMFQVCSIRIPQLQSITYPYTSVSWYPEYCNSMRIQGHLIAHWPGCCLNRIISMNSDSNNAILNYP